MELYFHTLLLAEQKRGHNERLFKLGSFAHKGACPYCNPSYLGLASMHAPSEGEKKRESNEGERAREGSTKGKGGLYKKLQAPTLPPKWPRSGVTFHLTIFCLDRNRACY